MERVKFFLVSCLIIFSICPVMADVVVCPLFGDNAVLQRDAKIPVWGKASAGEKITVKLADAFVSTTADKDGNWQVILPDHKAGGPYEMIVSGNNTVVSKDIYYGDVWFCSGQSNMAFTVAGVNNAQEEIQQATNNLIRHFKLIAKPSAQPQNFLQGAWKVCSPENVKTFSATAYFFARHLQPEIGVAIGLINSSVGGTRIEAWISRDVIAKIPELQVELTAQDERINKYKEAVDDYNQKLQQWNEAAEKAKQSGTEIPAKPEQPKLPFNPNSLSVLYNSMVAPVVNFPIKGILWYQGESNAGRNGYLYRTLLSFLIDDWRKAWKNQIPFIYVQLPNFGKVVDSVENSNWALLRESQVYVLNKPGTAMAVTIDIGEADNIHPRNKQDVGKRLALAALGTVYGKKIVYSGPVYAGMSVEGNKIRIKFNHTGSGLIAKDSDTLTGFFVAGEDKSFVKAKAKIENDTVVVWNDSIEKIVAVRYGWAGNPVCNLYNREGFPACPFRTDQW